MKFSFLKKKKKAGSLLLALVLVAAVFAGCEKEEGDESRESSTTSLADTVKERIDNLYMSEIDKGKEIVNISTGKSYTTIGDAKENDPIVLTDNLSAGDSSSSAGWAVFSYADVIEITIDFGGMTENITAFKIQLLQILSEKIYNADEVTVSASIDGTEFISLGLCNRNKTDDDSALSFYELTLSGAIRATHIRFTVISDKTGSAYIDEACVFAYGENSTEGNTVSTYEPFYGAKMPEKVTEPVYWDASESDYSKEQNLAFGKTTQVFTSNIEIDAEKNSTAAEVAKITDGKYIGSFQNEDSSLFTCYSPTSEKYYRYDGRLILIDLQKTSSISGFKTTFVKSTSSELLIPLSFSVVASEDGVAWDSVYRQDDARSAYPGENCLINIADSFDKKYCARFVAVFFDVSRTMRFDEIEILGTKSTEGATHISEQGTIKLFSGEYPVPSAELNGVNNIALLYHCYASTINGTTPVTGGFNEKQCMELLGYHDRAGNITDDYFDTCLFLPGGDTISWNKADMWKVYLENLYSEGYNLSALNSAAAKVGEALGKSDYKAKVMLTVLLPSMEYSSFGDLDGDGNNEDFATFEGKQKVMNWLIKEYVDRFTVAGYANLELVGFYWHDEVIRYDDLEMFKTIRYTVEKVKSLGYIMMACPYYLTAGYYEWANAGFDLVFYQPNYYWYEKHQDDDRIIKAAALAKMNGFGVEMEVESDAITDVDKLGYFIDYLKGGVEYGYMNAVHMYYFAHPFIGSCEATTDLGRQLYELNYRFMKGTLTFTETDAVLDEVYSCSSGDTISEKLTIKSSNTTLISSTKYGKLRFSSDGRFKYTPADGFTGEDSFFVEVMTTGADTIRYEIKIKVEN